MKGKTGEGKKQRGRASIVFEDSASDYRRSFNRGKEGGRRAVRDLF